MHLHVIEQSRGEAFDSPRHELARPNRRLRLVESTPPPATAVEPVRNRGRGLLLLVAMSALSWMLIGALVLSAVH